MSQRSISIAFQTDQPLAAYGALAAAAEDYGFDGVSVYNDMLFQPAWLPLLEIARHTRRVRIGPAAVNPFTCHPINIAGNIALLDEASQGRAYLGLARGAWLDFAGLDPPRPITALREAFECVRHLLRQSHEPYAGTIFPLAGGDSLRWRILRPDIPFLLGAWGARAIRACIALIDEIKVGGTASPDAIRQVRADIAAAAQAAGRDPQAIGVAVGAVTVVDHDGAAARALARRKAALYLPVIAELDRTLQLEPSCSSASAMPPRPTTSTARRATSPTTCCGAWPSPARPPRSPRRRKGCSRPARRGSSLARRTASSEESGMRLLGEVMLPEVRNDKMMLVTTHSTSTTWPWWSRRSRATAPATCAWATSSSCAAASCRCPTTPASASTRSSRHPLLPAKQRSNHPADWMETDARVTCPDPACRLIMRIDRVAGRTLRHDDVGPIAWDSLAE